MTLHSPPSSLFSRWPLIRARRLPRRICFCEQQNHYEPLRTSETCDVAIIGGGYTGVSTAVHLTRDPTGRPGASSGLRVRVLDAGHIGWGASARNAGFCCVGASFLSDAELVDRYGLLEARRYYAAQMDAVHSVRDIAAREQIACDVTADQGVWSVAHRPDRFAGLEASAKFLTQQLGVPTRVYTRDAFRAAAHNGTEQYGGVHVGVGFGLNPIRLLHGLSQAATRYGARLHGHSRVVEWAPPRAGSGGRHRLLTASGGVVTARHVLVATAGWSDDTLYPALSGRVLPIMSNIVVTRPLTHDELVAQGYRTRAPMSDTRDLLLYYRLLPDNRFLFGTRGDTTGRVDSAAHIRAHMLRRLAEQFPAWRNVPVTHSWRGFICATAKLTPAIGCADSLSGSDDSRGGSVWFAHGYHGTGVSTGVWAGEQIAALITGKQTVADLPAVMRGTGVRFPFPSLRLWGLRAMLQYYRFADER